MRVSAVHSPTVSSETRSKSLSRIPKTLCCVKRTPTPSVVFRECQKTCVLWHDSNNSMPSLTSASCATVIVRATSGPACCELERSSLIPHREIKASLGFLSYLEKSVFFFLSFLNKLSYLCQLSPSRNVRHIKGRPRKAKLRLVLLTFCCLEMFSMTRT